MHPKLLKPLPPTPLDGTPLPLDSTEDRRVHFADWLVSPRNTYFARSLVNRVWANFMGRGLVDPVDDVRATNPASNEELFAALSNDFVEDGYDVQRLIRTIMNSGVYQLSAESNATNQNGRRYYSRYFVKRLAGGGDPGCDVASDRACRRSSADIRRERARMQLPDSKVPSPFLASFGRPLRAICDASERSREPNIAQALHVINGDTLNKKLRSPDGYAALFLKLGLSERRIVEQLYLSAYSRYPTDQEREAVTKAMAGAVGRQGGRARESARRPDVGDADEQGIPVQSLRRQW